MNEQAKLEYGAKQMMLCGTNWSGGLRMHFPYVLLKGYWFLYWGFNPGDEVTIVNLAPGILTLQVTKTCEQFEKEGWGDDRRLRHDGLSYGQLMKLADDLLTSTQVFCRKVLDYTKAA